MAERKLPRFLTPIEVAEMFKAAAASPRDGMLLKCLYYLGLRNSELRAVLIEDIDATNMTVKVVHREGKRDRYVPVPGEFADELKSFAGGRSGLLFGGRGAGGGLSDRHLRRIVKEYARRANVRGCEEIHPHTLRHSYAAHLQDSGVPLDVIQKMLGHARPDTTAIYAHTSAERAREFIERAFRVRYGKGEEEGESGGA